MSGRRSGSGCFSKGLSRSDHPRRGLPAGPLLLVRFCLFVILLLQRQQHRRGLPGPLRLVLLRLLLLRLLLLLLLLLFMLLLLLIALLLLPLLEMQVLRVNWKTNSKKLPPHRCRTLLTWPAWKRNGCEWLGKRIGS